jgi:hypothetical protein
MHCLNSPHPRVFLIANNGFIQDHHIIDLNIDYHNDIVVLFNFMYIPYDVLKYTKHKIAFLRTIYSPHTEETTGTVNTHYLGGVEFIDKQYDFDKLICVDDHNKYLEYNQNIHIQSELLIADTFMETMFDNGYIGCYTEGKSPTTGFVAYLYMKYLYPQSDIVLVGYTGHYADGTTPDNLHHDYLFEQHYYKTHNVKRKYTSIEELLECDCTST